MDHPQDRQDAEPVRPWEWLTLTIVIILGGVLRIWMATSAPGLWYDEAINGLDALSTFRNGEWKMFFDTGTHVREPLYMYLEMLGIGVFGTSAFAIRVVSSVIGIATIPVVWWLAREYRGRYFALLALLVFALMRWHIHFSGLAFRTILAPFVLSFVLLFLIRMYRRRTLRDGVLAGIFLGLGAYTYLAFRLVPLAIAPPMLLWLLRDWKDRDRFTGTLKLQGALVAAAAIVFLPLAIHFIQRPDHFTGRSDEVSFFSRENAGKLLLSQARDVALMPLLRGDHVGKHNLPGPPTFLQPWRIDGDEVAALWQQEAQNARSENRPPMDKHGTGLPAFPPIAGFLFYIGLGFTIYTCHKSFEDQLLICTLLVCSLASILSFGAPNMLRLLILVPVVTMFIVRGIAPMKNLFKATEAMHDWDAVAYAKRQRAGGILAIAVPCAILLINASWDLTRLAHWRSHPFVVVEFNKEWADMGEYLRTQPDRLPVRLPIDPHPTLRYLTTDYSINPPPSELGETWWEFRPLVNFGVSWQPLGKAFPSSRHYRISHPQGFPFGDLVEVQRQKGE